MKTELKDISKLKKVSTYARLIEKSTTWVYKLAEAGEIKIIDIDGVKYVECKA